jgi:hypothetical protein
VNEISTMQAPAGWYVHPNGHPGLETYWDGTQWTNAQRPIGPAQPEKAKNRTGDIVAGYILAFIMPIVGFIVGIVFTAQRRNHGLGILIASVVFFVFWVAVFSA